MRKKIYRMSNPLADIEIMDVMKGYSCLGAATDYYDEVYAYDDALLYKDGVKQWHGIYGTQTQKLRKQTLDVLTAESLWNALTLIGMKMEEKNLSVQSVDSQTFVNMAASFFKTLAIVSVIFLLLYLLAFYLVLALLNLLSNFIFL